MLTPLDIQNTVFHRSFRGYNEAEVDEFLDRLVVEYEQVFKENQVLKEELASRATVAAARFVPEDEPETLDLVTPEPPAENVAGRAADQESAKLAALKRQYRLFVTQFRAMLASYEEMIAEAESKLEEE